MRDAPISCYCNSLKLSSLFSRRSRVATRVLSSLFSQSQALIPAICQSQTATTHPQTWLLLLQRRLKRVSHTSNWRARVLDLFSWQVNISGCLFYHNLLQWRFSHTPSRDLGFSTLSRSLWAQSLALFCLCRLFLSGFDQIMAPLFDYLWLFMILMIFSTVWILCTQVSVYCLLSLIVVSCKRLHDIWKELRKCILWMNNFPINSSLWIFIYLSEPSNTLWLHS